MAAARRDASTIVRRSITLKQAAEAFDVSTHTIQRYVELGHLRPYFLPTGSPRIFEADIAKLQSNTSVRTANVTVFRRNLATARTRRQRTKAPEKTK